MATIQEKGKLVSVCNEKSGTSKAGKPWRSVDAVVEIPNVYGSIRRLALRCVNERADDIQQVPIGSAVAVVYIVSSNEWQGRWFTTAEMCRVDIDKSATSPATAPSAETPKQGDLPF